jgi:Fe2+ or Zn2+ uptake regulation protein
MSSTDSLQSLRDHGFRLTPQRLAILQVIEESSGHLSAAEIFQLASRRIPGVTEATIYRTLDFLVEHGMALIAHVGSGRIVYESAAENHHHLICHKCGSAVVIDHNDLIAVYSHLEKITGYQLDSSHVTFFGLCPGCAAAVKGQSA